MSDSAGEPMASIAAVSSEATQALFTLTGAGSTATGAAAGASTAIGALEGVSATTSTSSLTPTLATGLATTASALRETTASQATTAPSLARMASETGALEQIKVQIGKGLADGKDVITVSLHPDEMGKVEVKLELKGGQVSATVTADRPETLQVLKADASGLQQSLTDAGLSADANSLSFQLRGEGQQGQSGQDQTAQDASTSRDVGIEVTSEAVVSTNASLTEGDGLDISV